MKRSSGLIKRNLALILVFLLSIENFAAVVGDNDGATFITKAEFDSLKNDFQNQLDRYNSSIDNKIDVAIASYLVGTRASKTTIYNIEHQTGSDKWNYVKMMNFSPVEILQAPNLNINFGVFGASLFYNAKYRMCWYTNADLIYAVARNSVATRNRRNCINLGTEIVSGNPPDTCGWLGRSYDLEDSMMGYKELATPNLWRTASSGDDAKNTGYLRGPQSSSLNIVRALQFNSGYFDKSNIYQNWKSTVFYCVNNTPAVTGIGHFYADGTQWTDYAKAALNTAIKLNKIDGNEYFDKHILNWKSINMINPTEPSWSSWLGSLKTISQDDFLKNEVTKSGIWGVHETGDYVNTSINKQYDHSVGTVDNRTYHHQAFGRWDSGEYQGTTSDDLKGVGIIEKTYSSDKILQWFTAGSDNKYALNRDENVKVDAMNLLNGYLVGSLKSGDTFEWEPTISGYYFPYAKTQSFHNYTKKGTTYKLYGDYCLDGNCTDPNHHVTEVPKWRIVLATCYFGEGTNYLSNTTIDGKNNGKIIKEEGQTTDYKELDNGGKVKFKFKADDDCIVVAKWYPTGMKQYGTSTGLSADDCYWYGTLDLTQCGTYSVTSEG